MMWAHELNIQVGIFVAHRVMTMKVFV